MENKKEKGKKAKLWWVTVLIVLLLGVFFGFGYALGAKKFVNIFNDTVKKEIKNDDNKIDTEEKTVEENTVTKEETKIQIEDYSDIPADGSLTEENLNAMLVRIKQLNRVISDTYPLNDISELSNQKALQVGFYNQSNTSTINVDTVEINIDSLLGDNIKVKHEDFLCPYDNLPFFKYNSNNGYYTFDQSHPGHDGFSKAVTTFFDSASQIDDKLIIRCKLLFNAHQSAPVMAYNDANGNKVIDDIPPEELTNKYNEVKDSIPVTTYVFEKSPYYGYNLKSITTK